MGIRRESSVIGDPSIRRNKIVLGICLGAQIIADVLGARVYRHSHREIGWFPVRLTEEGKKTGVFSCFEDVWMAFHWHGDTFEIPSDAVRIAESEGCLNQAFQYKDRVLALQFHLDYSEESILAMIENCSDEIDGSRYVQSAEETTENVRLVRNLEANLQKMLKQMTCLSH